MSDRSTIWNKSYHPSLLVVFLVVLSRCVSPISFEIEEVPKQYIVEGLITDGPPPYVVKVGSTVNLTSDSLQFSPESGATVILYDDQGREESFVETDSGYYESSGIIQGEVGRSYHVTIQTQGGSVLRSIPDHMNAVGSIRDIRIEYEERSVEVSYGEEAADVFNIFIDADGGVEEAPLIRWRTTGVFKVVTYPAFRMTEVPPYTPYKNPVPCSGYIVDEYSPGGKLKQVGPCTCCDCWVSRYTDLPQLSSEFFVTDNHYQNVKVGEVDITNYTLHDKYMVMVEQMSLSENALLFFESIRAQKVSISDLFQPQLGALYGNVTSDNNRDIVLGMVYASSVTSSSIYIDKSDVPYNLKPITFITENCEQAYDNSSNKKPDFWID